MLSSSKKIIIDLNFPKQVSEEDRVRMAETFVANTEKFFFGAGYEIKTERATQNNNTKEIKEKICFSRDVMKRNSKNTGFRYESFGDKIGEGSYSDVYDVNTWKKVDERMVFIDKHPRVAKVFNLTLYRKEGAKDILKREVKISKRIDYLKAKDLVEISENQAVLIMAKIFDQSLLEYMQKKLLKDESEKLDICISLLENLVYLARKEILHCDIKPENIRISREKPITAKLIDFGFAQFLTDKKKACGTVLYIAPEIFICTASPLKEKSAEINLKSDLCSAGIVIFELLCGVTLRESSQDVVQFLHKYIQLCKSDPTGDSYNREIRERLKLVSKKFHGEIGEFLSRILFIMIQYHNGLRCAAEEALEIFKEIKKYYLDQTETQAKYLNEILYKFENKKFEEIKEINEEDNQENDSLLLKHSIVNKKNPVEKNHSSQENKICCRMI